MEEKYDFYKHGQFTVEIPKEKCKLISLEIWVTALGCGKKFVSDSVIYNELDGLYLLTYKQEQ